MSPSLKEISEPHTSSFGGRGTVKDSSSSSLPDSKDAFGIASNYRGVREVRFILHIWESNTHVHQKRIVLPVGQTTRLSFLEFIVYLRLSLKSGTSGF